MIAVAAERLGLTKVASCRVAGAGQEVVYTLGVSNKSRSAIAQVTACDSIPSHLI